MIFIYLLIFQIYNPSKIEPFEIFKKLENPPESLFMVLPKRGKEIEFLFGFLNDFKFLIFKKNYFLDLNSLFIYPEKSRYFEFSKEFCFYPFFPDTLLSVKNYFWNWGKEKINFLMNSCFKFSKNKNYFKVFVKDTGNILIKNESYVFNYLQGEIGIKYIGAGFLKEFIHHIERDFFVSPYIFFIFEFKLLQFYPQIYFDLIKNKFYPMFSLYFSPSPFHIFKISYEKRSFLNLLPSFNDDFLPFFNFKDSISSFRGFKEEIFIGYEGRIFEKFYLNFKNFYYFYENFKIFEKEEIWKEKLFENIKVKEFSGILKYQFSKFFFSINYLYLSPIDYWKNKFKFSFCYDFKISKISFTFFYPFKFKNPIFDFKIYFYPRKSVYLKAYLRWLKEEIKYYKNISSEIGVGIGIKEN